MTVLATIAFAAFLLEDDHFLALQGSENLAFHFCAFHGRHTDLNVAVGINEENFVERNGFAFFHFLAEIMNIQVFAFLGFELLSFNFYDSVNLNY